VLTQIFTCSTAVDPILVAGLTPAYAEVAPRSIAIDPERCGLESAEATAVGATRAVVIQNTFGIIDTEAAAQIADTARARGVVVIEDSAHCVTRMATRGGTPIADISIHSFGVEKMLPTFFGGAVWVSPDLDPALRIPLVAALNALPVASGRLAFAARAYRTQIRVLTRLPGALARPLRRCMVTLGLFDPAVSDVESRGGLPYPAKAPSDSVLAAMRDALQGLDHAENQRKDAVAVYRKQLHDVASSGLIEIPAAIGHDPLVRFPFFATSHAEAERLITELSKRGYYVGRWYRPALFPGVVDEATYGYTPGDPNLATTEDLIARVVNLPTSVAPDEAHSISRAVLDILNSTDSKEAS
jgi:dTDP-4-amino-4,6-dideoxygalactose transaminase